METSPTVMSMGTLTKWAILNTAGSNPVLWDAGSLSLGELLRDSPGGGLLLSLGWWPALETKEPALPPFSQRRLPAELPFNPGVSCGP